MAEEKLTHPLHDIMDAVTGRAKESEKASWPVTLFLLAGLVIAISFLGIKLAMAKRKAAELAIKMRRAEEEKARAEEDAKLKENKDEQKEAWTRVRERSKEILSLKAQMIVRMKKHEQAVKDLQAITSWDDFVVVDDREQP